MSWVMTEKGYNMYDMLSMLQKSARRSKYSTAAFAANQVKNKFRKVMWNRILVISAEDCYGVITKEIIKQKKLDDECHTDNNIARAVALLCISKKSRDACYFSCNFVLASRNPRKIVVSNDEIFDLKQRIEDKRENYQMSFEDLEKRVSLPIDEPYLIGCQLQKALKHRDMDMVGFKMDLLRASNRELLWKIFRDYAEGTGVEQEVEALKTADDIVNNGKKEKDEIFISKCAILLMHNEDPGLEDIRSSDMISLTEDTDWSEHKIKPIASCKLPPDGIPEWVYDCHTLKGKAAGKTDWDMTTTEQAALTPLQLAYFDEASWIYTYQWDYEHGIESEEHMKPIWEYAETHPVNPVEFIPYEDGELE